MASILDFFDPSQDLSSLVQGSIDARSSKPPVKEDDVDRDKSRESAEKQKFAKDLEKNKEKKKNLERQALETRRAKSRQRGEPEEDSPDEDDGDEGDNGSDDSEGWRPVSTESSRARRKPTSSSRGQGPLSERRAGPTMANKGSPLRAVLVPTHLQCLRRVRPSPAPNLHPHLRRAIGLSLWRWGR